MSGIYLDSCIVIYLIEGPDPFREVCYQVLATWKTGGVQLLCFTDLTRLECRLLPMCKGQQQVLEEYDNFFSLPETRLLSIDERVFEMATELRAFQNLKTPDAGHRAAAIHHGCTEFWTNDLRLKSAAADRLRIVNPFDSVKE
jgi:predicted nucleic acid-binding protein